MPRLCPECWAGKHGNCDSVADLDKDGRELVCECGDSVHERNLLVGD